MGTHDKENDFVDQALNYFDRVVPPLPKTYAEAPLAQFPGEIAGDEPGPEEPSLCWDGCHDAGGTRSLPRAPIPWEPVKRPTTTNHHLTRIRRFTVPDVTLLEDGHRKTNGLAFLKDARIIDSGFVVLFFAASPLAYCTWNQDEGEWDIWDAFYFSVVTVTTVGYGDAVPTNDHMKIFTIFYILIGLALVATVIDRIIAFSIARYEKKMKQFQQAWGVLWVQLARDAGYGSDASDAGKKWAKRWIEPSSSRRRVISTALNASLLFALPVTIGTVFFALNEEWTWVDALYWSVVTCTTVGYGDLSLEHKSSRIFSAFFILGGFASVGAAIGRVGALKMELALEKSKAETLEKMKLSIEFISSVDTDGHGLDKLEFVCGMLQKAGKIEESDIKPLLDKFDELDSDGSGVLTHDDLEVHRSRGL